MADRVGDGNWSTEVRMNEEAEKLSFSYLEKGWHELAEREKEVIRSIIERKQISKNVNRLLDADRTFGERVADEVARFGGSWTFLIIFALVLAAWVVLNTFMLVRNAFDPYPYILLNLFLSMLASVQAPVIMMSQNRQAARDRLDAAHDYQVNLKAELEIREIQEKLDELRERKWAALLEMQERQLGVLEELLHRLTRQ
jgi:uncharacterized membrane protein